jgi:hypothetical protein
VALRVDIEGASVTPWRRSFPIQTDTELGLSASSTRFIFRKHLHASDDADEDDDDEGGRGGCQFSRRRLLRRSEARG